MPPFLKRIGAALLGRKGYGFMRSSLPDAKLDWGPADFLTANQVSLYTSRAIAKRAEKVGEVEFYLTDASGKEIPRDPMLDLLYKPNGYMTGAEFWATFQKHKDLAGSVFVWLERSESFAAAGRPTAMHLLRPDLTRPIVKDGAIVQFEYTKPSGGTLQFKPEDIFYSYYPDPLNVFIGEPLLRAAASAIDTEVQISQYHRKVLRNGGRVDGVFTFKGQQALTKQQVGELRDGYREQYAGAKKAGLPLFLGGDAAYSRMGLTPEELGYVAAKGLTLDDICMATGVPRPILANLTDAKFDNADAARAIFLSETIRPLLMNLTQKLDEFLFPDDRILRFRDPTPENAERNIQVANAGATSYFLSINERRALFGMEPVEGGDTILVPFNLIPANDAADGAALPAPQGNAAPQPARKASQREHPLRDPFIRKRYGQVRAIRMERLEAKFARSMREFFRGQKRRIEFSLEGHRAMAGAETKGLMDGAFDKALEAKLTSQHLLPLIRQLLEQGGQDAMELAGDDGPYKPSIDMGAWIEQRSNVLGTELTATTYDALRQAFTASEGAGESREALIRRISEVYSGFAGARATTIARTEVHGAYQRGTTDGYKAAGVQSKIWVAVADEKTRDDHLAADGMEVPIDQPFDIGGESLMFPGDPSGSAEQTINCRCTI